MYYIPIHKFINKIITIINMGGTHSAFVKEIKKIEPSSDKLLSLIDALRDENKINLNDIDHLPPILLVCQYLQGNNLILTLERLLQYGANAEMFVMYVYVT